jgi:hypothetical protein
MNGMQKMHIGRRNAPTSGARMLPPEPGIRTIWTRLFAVSATANQ